MNKWQEQLEKDVRDYEEQASRVSGWDKQLMTNQQDISKIADDLQRLNLEQSELDMSLNEAEEFQNKLNTDLGALETQVQKLFEKHSHQLADNADYERESMFDLSKTLQHQLDVMLEQLKGLVDDLNSAYARRNPENNQVTKIMKVLNRHHQLLTWLDGKSMHMEREVSDLERRSSASRHPINGL